MKTRYLTITVGPVKKLSHRQLSRLAAGVHFLTHGPKIARPGVQAGKLIDGKGITEDTAVSLAGHVIIQLKAIP